MFKFSDKEASRWEKVREKGKWFYIARKTLVINLSLTIAYIVANLLFEDPIEIKPVFFILYLLLGFFGALIDWQFSDAKYQTYLLDRKIADGLKIQV